MDKTVLSARQLLELYPFLDPDESTSPKKPIIPDQGARSRSLNPKPQNSSDQTLLGPHEQENCVQSEMLSTIKLPKNLKKLNQGLLP